MLDNVSGYHVGSWVIHKIGGCPVTAIRSWGVTVVREPRGGGLKLTADAHRFLDGLKAQVLVGKATAASNIIAWIRSLDEPRWAEVMVYNLEDCPRRRNAARALIRAIARKSLPPEECEAVCAALREE